MYLRTTNVFRTGGMFYKDGAIFKGHLRKTMADARRAHGVERASKYHNQPKTVRRTFKEDYQAFKDRRGMQDVYISIAGKYEHDVNVGQFQVVVPVYVIENNRIKKIYREYRGRYPLSILEVIKVSQLPREGGDIDPDEKIYDTIKKYGRDAQMFVALSGQNAELILDNTQDRQQINITGTGYPLVNEYNFGYKYDNGRIIAAPQPDLD